MIKLKKEELVSKNVKDNKAICCVHTEHPANDNLITTNKILELGLRLSVRNELFRKRGMSKLRNSIVYNVKWDSALNCQSGKAQVSNE